MNGNYSFSLDSGRNDVVEKVRDIGLFPKKCRVRHRKKHRQQSVQFFREARRIQLDIFAGKLLYLPYSISFAVGEKAVFTAVFGIKLCKLHGLTGFTPADSCYLVSDKRNSVKSNFHSGTPLLLV